MAVGNAPQRCRRAAVNVAVVAGGEKAGWQPERP